MSNTGVTKRFTLPPRCSVSEIVMRELTGNDQVDAAVFADANCAPGLRDNPLAMMAAEQDAAVGLSLVEVDGVPASADGVPYTGMKKWTARTKRFVMRAFSDLNGATDLELETFSKGAEPQAARTRPPKMKAVGGRGDGAPTHEPVED